MVKRIVLICGDVEWKEEQPILALLTQLQQHYSGQVRIIEGEARGTDRLARDLAQRLHLEVVGYPAQWAQYHRAAGPLRNQQMLEEGRPDEVHAFYVQGGPDKGTANMIAQARKACVPVIEHPAPPVLDVMHWEQLVNRPLRDFAGRCATAAHVSVALGLAIGTERYGAWTGPVAPGTLFASRPRLGMVRHGWVELMDGRIYDPTRWVFEGREPYLYLGANDYYDHGNDRLRVAMHGSEPCPSNDCPNCGERGCAQQPVELTRLFAEEIRLHPDVKIEEELPPGQPNATLSLDQLVWLCNRPLAHWKRCYDGAVVLKGLIRDGHGVWLPLDTRNAYGLP